MHDTPIPPFCIPCIQRMQAKCAHKHTYLTGHFYLSFGEVTDDITEFCMDCGANLDLLPMKCDPLPEKDVPIPF